MLIIGSKYNIVRMLASTMLSLISLLLLCEVLWKYCHGTSNHSAPKLTIQLVLPIDEVEMKQETSVLNKKEEVELDILEKKFEPEEITLQNPFDTQMKIEKPIITEIDIPVNKKPEKKKKKDVKKTELKKIETVVKPDIEVTIDKENANEKINTEVVEQKVIKTSRSEEIPAKNTVKPQLSKTQINENSKYLARVMKIFEKNKKYPDDARRHHLEGKIIIAFKIRKDGKTDNVVAKTNNPKELVLAAEKLVKNSKLPLPPDSWQTDASVEIPIIYKLK